MIGTNIGWQIEHGDCDSMVATIRQAAEMSPAELTQIGEAGKRLVDRTFSKEILGGTFCDLLG
jgi:hypothetical protein